MHNITSIEAPAATAAHTTAAAQTSDGKRQTYATNIRTNPIICGSITEKGIARRIELAKRSSILDLSLDVGSSPLGLWPSLRPIASLSKVRTFLIEKQALRILPNTAFKSMKRLVSVSLRNNKLSTVPNEIGSLTHLRHLLVEGNKLKCLPENLVNLQRLEELRADDNCLTTFPRDVVTANNALMILTLTNNPLMGPAPVELVGSLSRLLLFAADPREDASIYTSGPDIHSAGVLSSVSTKFFLGGRKENSATSDLCTLVEHHHDKNNADDELFAKQYLAANKLRSSSRATDLARSAETIAYQEIKNRAKTRPNSKRTNSKASTDTLRKTGEDSSRSCKRSASSRSLLNKGRVVGLPG